MGEIMKITTQKNCKYQYTDIDEWQYNKYHIFFFPYKNHKIKQIKETYNIDIKSFVLYLIGLIVLSLVVGYITGGLYKLWFLIFGLYYLNCIYTNYMCFLNDVTEILKDDFVPMFAFGFNALMGYIVYIVASKNKFAFIIAFFVSSYVLIKALKFTNFETENKKPE